MEKGRRGGVSLVTRRVSLECRRAQSLLLHTRSATLVSGILARTAPHSAEGLSQLRNAAQFVRCIKTCSRDALPLLLLSSPSFMQVLQLQMAECKNVYKPNTLYALHVRVPRTVRSLQALIFPVLLTLLSCCS